MFQFDDPITAGVVLVIPAIQSPNFQHGISGWAIKIDGTAEFNSATIRGIIAAGQFIGVGTGGEVLIYAGPPALGNLITSISAAAGTDPEGNPYPEGLQVSNSAGQGIHLLGTQLIFAGSNKYNGGGGGSAAYMYAPPATTTSNQSVVYFVGPTDNANQAILQLLGESDDGTQLPYAALFNFDVATQTAVGGVPFALSNVAAPPAGLTGAVMLYSTAQYLALVGNGYLGTITAVQPGTTATPETWHPMTLLATWAVQTGSYAHYKLMPGNEVWIQAKLVAGTLTNSTTIWTAPSGYIPVNAHAQTSPVVCESGTGTASILTPYVSLNSSGNLQVQNLPSGLVNCSLNFRYALDTP